MKSYVTTVTYSVIFSAVIGTLCAVLLTGASRVADPYKVANARAEVVRNVLEVLEVSFDRKAPAGELVKIFDANIRQSKRGQLEIYEYTPQGGAVQAVAVPFSGQGVWGPVKGFISLEADMKTIRGVTFYEQEETPGLGSEIARPAFRNRFKGKSILAASGEPGIRVRRGGGQAVNEVDAISGATMTCDRVEQILTAAARGIVREVAGR